MSRRQILNLSIGTVVTIACLAAAFWGFKKEDYVEIGQSFQRADYRTVPLFVAYLTLFFWLKALRWVLLLKPLKPGEPLTVRQSLPALMVGFMGNNVLPAHLGDFVRIFLLARQFRLSNAAVFSTVVLERIWDIAAILAILGWGLAAVPNAPPEARSTGYVLALLLVIGLIGIAIYALKTAWFVRTTESVLARIPILPSKIKHKAAELLEAGALGMVTLRNWRLTFWIVVTSILHWILNVLMIDLALQAFGIEQPLAVSAIVMGVVAFGVTLPSTPGFFGVIQMAFRLTLVPFAVKATDAVAASVYYHLIQWVIVTLIGLIYLQRTGMKLRQLEQAADQAEADAERELPVPI